MTSRARLLEAHAELTASIRSAESWEKSYTDSPETFKRLLRQEAKLQAASNQYLLGLAERTPSIVNWAEAGLKPVQASAVPPANDETFQREMALLTALVGPQILELLVTGGNAGETLYERSVGFSVLHEAVITAADTLTATMVSQVTDTTRRFIQLAIKQSIASGEDVTASIKRIRKLVANPVRAEMIAQTESVNAYQAGLDIFGEETGVISWTWDSLSGACKLCAPLNGVTKKVGELFTLPNGRQVARPAAHTKCRCGRRANYDN